MRKRPNCGFCEPEGEVVKGGKKTRGCDWSRGEKVSRKGKKEIRQLDISGMLEQEERDSLGLRDRRLKGLLRRRG